LRHELGWAHGLRGHAKVNHNGDAEPLQLRRTGHPAALTRAQRKNIMRVVYQAQPDNHRSAGCQYNPTPPGPAGKSLLPSQNSEWKSSSAG